MIPRDTSWLAAGTGAMIFWNQLSLAPKSSMLNTQGCYTVVVKPNDLKLGMVEEFIPWKLASATNKAFYIILFFSEPAYRHTDGLI